jgi:hypothetical protein
MRKRRLTRREALEEYIIYRKRIREFLDVFQIVRDIKNGAYKPRDPLGRGPDRFWQTISDVLVGLFVSLIDAHPATLNVFDVWPVLFPGKAARISETWRKMTPNVQLIRDYRNDVVAHANKGLRRYVNTGRRFYEGRAGVVEAMQEFGQLAAELMRDEATALPNLGSEVDPILRDLLPRASNEDLEGLKDYFLGGGGPAGAEQTSGAQPPKELLRQPWV